MLYSCVKNIHIKTKCNRRLHLSRLTRFIVAIHGLLQNVSIHITECLND